MQRKSYDIKFHEVDCNNRLKEPVLLNFLQDIAADNAEKIGLGYSIIKDKNIGWFLTKYHIKIFSPICAQDKIHIETVSKGAIKINAFRDFDIYNSDNEKIGEATSSWVVTDLTNFKVLLPETIFGDAIFPAVRSELRSTFPKIPSPSKIDFQKDFYASYNDLDINKHVNNSIYLIWAEETLPFDILSSSRIAELDIQYKKQVQYGEKVTVYTQYEQDNNEFLQELKTSNGETVCLIKQIRKKMFL